MKCVEGVGEGVAESFLINQKEARGGIASAAAVAGVPSLGAGQQYNIGLGLGHFKSQSALALGGHAQISKNLTAKFAVGISAGDKVVSSGMSLSF